MQCCFAPMEGITGYVYRNAHQKHFGHITEYYTPFITPNQTRKFAPRELNDICPEHNKDIPLVPQILTNNSEDFLWAAERMKGLGYREINLNLGCPSGTVVSKKRGAGFLADPFKLDQFLYQISEQMDRLGMALSLKTRIGMTDPVEFEDLLEIYNRYSLKRLIIHPRLRIDYYKNRPNLACFQMAVDCSKNPLYYNGDLFSPEDVALFCKQFPSVSGIMLGRGILTNPALPVALTGDNTIITTGQLKDFHEDLLEGYRRAIPGDRNVLFKMKELWYYLQFAFEEGEKPLKKIKKSQRMEDYRAAADEMFAGCRIKESPVFQGGAGYGDECGNR